MIENQENSGKFVIETRELWRKYKRGSRQEVAALRGVDMRIKYGQLVALRGRSGSGKTTLLNCIGGLDQPTSGVVRVFDKNLANMNDKQLTDLRRDRLGFVFQSFSLLPTFSAYENVELMLRMAGKSRDERKRRTLYCLGIVGLEKWVDHRPAEMSGGQQQRTAIARALANQPELILADEPTGELDSKTAREILNLFQQIVVGERVTVVVATHDNLVEDYADKVLELKDGMIN